MDNTGQLNQRLADLEALVAKLDPTDKGERAYRVAMIRSHGAAQVLRSDAADAGATAIEGRASEIRSHVSQMIMEDTGD